MLPRSRHPHSGLRARRVAEASAPTYLQKLRTSPHPRRYLFRALPGDSRILLHRPHLCLSLLHIPVVLRQSLRSRHRLRGRPCPLLRPPIAHHWSSRSAADILFVLLKSISLSNQSLQFRLGRKRPSYVAVMTALPVKTQPHRLASPSDLPQ